MSSSERRKRNENLNIRVTPEQKLVITRAARIKQTTVSNFVLDKAYEAAQDIVSEQRHLTLSAEQWKAFCDALEAAPREYPRLHRLLTEPSVFEQDK